MAEINEFLSKDAEKQVKNLVKLMDQLAKSYGLAFTNSKKLDEQLKKVSKSTDENNKKKQKLTELQKEEARILTATEKTRAKLEIIQGKAGKLIENENKLLAKNQELLKAKNRELRAEVKETGVLEGAFRKLNQRRAEAAKRLKDLVASERASTKEIKRAQVAFDRLDKKVQKANRSARQFQSNVGNYPKLLGASTRALGGFLTAFGFVGGIQLFARAVQDAFRQIREFDKQIIAVQKTTNLSNAEIKLFKDEVISLGRELKGISIQGLLKASEVAGQLGIKGRANILKFSKVIEQLKLTSDIAGEEAVRSFAKFIEISVDTVENADRLGSVITELGNNFATSESQILHNTIEIQKGLAIYDASAQGVIALGAATNALGSQAEASRGALQQTFKVLNEGVVSGKNLKRILDLTGQSAEEFRREFGADSIKTFQRFINGLGDSAKSGVNLSKTLSELGLDAKRVEAVVGILAKNTNVLNDALDRANREYKENNALIKEAELAAKSIDSIIGDLDDAWTGLILSIDNGDGIIATATRTILKFGIAILDVATKMAESNPELKTFSENIKDLTIEEKTKELEGLTMQADKYKKSLDNVNISTEEFLKLSANQRSDIRRARHSSEQVQKDLNNVNAKIEILNRSLKKKTIIQEDENDLTEENTELTEEQIKALRKAAKLRKTAINDWLKLNGAIEKTNSGLSKFGILTKEQETLLKFTEAIFGKSTIDEDAQKFLSKIGDSIKKTGDLSKEAREKEEREDEESEQRKADIRNKILTSSFQLLSEISQGFTDNKIQQLSDESNALELQRQTQLEGARGDKDKEAQINAQFDKKQAQIKEKQWKAEQQGALFQIAIGTGVNAVKAFPNLVLIGLALALGLAQAAFVKAQKPPKFGKGSKGLKKDTYGEVGEAGRELLFMPGGGVALAEKSTKALLPRGTVIKTNKETEQILAANQLKASRENDVAMRDYSELRILGKSLTEDRKSILKAVNDRDQYIFQVSKEGVKALMKNGRGTTTYLDTRFP